MDYQTGKIQKDPLKKLTVIEQYYNELFQEYKEREFSEFTTTRIIIPKGTRMVVWNDHRSFVGDMLTYIDHWKNRGDHTFIIPYGKELSIQHYSTKDIDIPLVLWSPLMSHIIAQRTNTNYSIMDGQERYGLWIKMYEQPTFIPRLFRTIVAYGVWEQEIPEEVNMKHNPLQSKGWKVTVNSVWVCQYCGQNTSDVEYDYLSGTNHLSCELQNSMGTNC